MPSLSLQSVVCVHWCTAGVLRSQDTDSDSLMTVENLLVFTDNSSSSSLETAAVEIPERRTQQASSGFYSAVSQIFSTR